MLAYEESINVLKHYVWGESTQSMVVLQTMWRKRSYPDLGLDVMCTLFIDSHISSRSGHTENMCLDKWLKLISRYRFRMTKPEESQLKEKTQKRQQQRRLRASTERLAPEEVQALQERARTYAQTGSEQVEEREGAIHLEHASFASPYIVTTRHWDSNPLPLL